MKSLFLAAVLFAAMNASFADVVVRCKQPGVRTEMLKVSFAKYENGSLNLYNYDSDGVTAQIVKTYPASAACLVSAVVSYQPQ